MKKCLKCIPLAAVLMAMVLVAAACAGQQAQAPAPAAEPPAEAPAAPEAPAEEPADAVAEEPAAPTGTGMAASDIQIALIAHSPDSILDDHSFNQGAWEGIQRFLSNHGGSADFFQPHVASDEARIDMINDAIGAGANILVLPGFHFETSLYDAQDMFPDVNFVLLDASPRSGPGAPARIEANVAAIHYAEEQSGFLAGYAAVMEGYRGLGFMGGIAVPAVVRFGHGFIQGAEHAAASLGLEPGEVTINYHYLNQFAPDPAFVTQAQAWFTVDTEVIFAAAGGAGGSVMAGAEAAGGSVIGVDVDQGHLSPSVVNSAIKALDISVYDMLIDFMNGEFRSGELRFDATNNGVGLAMASSRFENFTQAQHDALLSEIAGGAITVDATVTPTVSEANLNLTLVNLIEH